MTFARRTSCLKRTAWQLLGCQSRCPAGQILFTFDDGPHPEHTPAVLDRLAKYNLTAVFFLVGKRIADPNSVKQIAEHGHDLGNHTFAHARPRWSDIAVSRTDATKCQELVPEAKLFRPPLGRLTPGLWLAARRLGLRTMNWSLDSGDWRCRSAADAAKCAAEVLELICPGDIVLFHDDHRWIGPILDAILPALFQPRLEEAHLVEPACIISI